MNQVSSKSAPLLLLPAIAFIAIVFGAPLLFLVRMSLNAHPADAIYVEAFTLENYVKVFGDANNLATIGETLGLSLVTAVVTVVMAYAFALAVWSRGRRKGLILIGVALCPMMISEISVIIGWRLFFPANGFLSHILLTLGITSHKINLLGTGFAAVVGLTYISISYCFLTIYSVLSSVDRNLLLASGDLGASPLRTFTGVLLPLTKGGIASAFTQAFVFTMGIYATVNALGPDSLWTMGYEIQRQMLARRDWPMASALAVVLIVIIVLTIFAVQSIRYRKDGRDVRRT